VVQKCANHPDHADPERHDKACPPPLPHPHKPEALKRQEPTQQKRADPGREADPLGNLVYRKAARNFNPVMATAAETVIVEVDEIVPVGALDPEHIITPSIFVDRVVQAKGFRGYGK